MNMFSTEFLLAYWNQPMVETNLIIFLNLFGACLLYTSDAADE